MAIYTSFGTKKNGDGREISNIIHSLQKQNIKYSSVIQPSQYHSGKSLIVTNENVQVHFRCDGLVTAEKGIVLTILTADCVPIIFRDQTSGVIGISHNGWKGTLCDLSSVMIQNICSLGSQKKDIECFIGPSIRDCCYEIYGERKNDFVNRFGPSILRNTNHNSYLNLQEANKINLLKSGIISNNIHMNLECTSCRPDKYWSYHRDGHLKGEHISFVVSI